jgi:hypothetical protein
VHGKRLYTLSPNVTSRGAHYARKTVDALLAGTDCDLSSADRASVLSMHTGSGRILDKLCEQFGVRNDSETVAPPSRVLGDHSNTIGCAEPAMFAEPSHRPEGEGILVAFGLSSSCGAFSMAVPKGGWTR